MEMPMIRIAVIAKINDSYIDLLIFDKMQSTYSENCDAFEGCKRCGCGLSGQSFRAGIPKNLSLKVGDRVEVSASIANALGAFLAIIGIPALVGFLSWEFIGTVFPAISEPARALAAALGLALGAGLTILVAGKRNKLPEITRILE